MGLIKAEIPDDLHRRLRILNTDEDVVLEDVVVEVLEAGIDEVEERKEL